MSRMSWMSELMDKGNYVYRIQEKGNNFGNITLPTGIGKSGVIIEDIIYRLEHYKPGKKLNIVVSCPILKLTQQLVNDLFDAIKLRNLSTDNIRFFINSSDIGDNYSVDDLDMDANKFIDFDRFSSDINIIAACHKSMWKLVQNVEKYRENAVLINYFDESHLLPILQYSQTEDGENIPTKNRIDLDKLCKNSNSVFLSSATPDETITDIIKKYEIKPYEFKKEESILYLKPRHAIQNGDILPPMVKYLRSNQLEINIDNLKAIMNDAKSSNPNIYHKILITVNSKQQMKKLAEEIDLLKIKVFSICSPEDGYEDFEHANIQEFSNEVESYEGDCFVIHIRMLREGIDIKGLTDCVLYSRDHGKQEKYRMTIQTIGRVLRCLPGERGKQFVGTKERAYMDSDRKKKYGGVYFISPAEDTSVESAIRSFVERYYGLDSVIFKRASVKEKGGTEFSPIKKQISNPNDYTTGSSDEELNKLLISIKDTLNERYRKILKSNLPNVKPIYELIKKECDSGSVMYSGNFDTVAWLMDTSITEFIYEKVPSMFEDIGFDTKLWKSLTV